MRATPVLLALMLLPSLVLAQSFEGLGDLPGGSTSSEALAISADGRVVVGVSNAEGGDSSSGLRLPFRWEGGTMEALPIFSASDPRLSRGLATGISSDGSVIVGTSSDNSQSNAIFVRWVDGALERLSVTGATDGGTAGAVSADGTTIVGQALRYPAPGTEEREAYRWQNGTSQTLGYLAGDQFSFASGVSADGSVVVGTSNRFIFEESRPFRWDGTLQELTVPGGAFEASATVVSADGSIVAGHAAVSGFNYRPIRWVGANGTYLPALPNATQSFSEAISADGSVVVGRASTNAGNRAWIWTEAAGTRDLRSVLVGLGLDLEGWTLDQANGISADGTVIVGTGINPSGNREAFRAVLGEEAGLVVRSSVVSRESSRRDTLVVRATVENTGEIDLRDVLVPAAFTFEFAYADTIDVGSVRDPELSLVEGEADTTLAALPVGEAVDIDVRYVVDRAATAEVELAPGQTQTVQVSAEVAASKAGVFGFTDDDANRRVEAREEAATTCPFDPGAALRSASALASAEECTGDILPGSDDLLVNATTNNNDEDPGDGVCATGETVTVDGERVDECTFRAAWQEAAAALASASLRIDFDIPGGDEGEPHVLDLSGEALPSLRGTLLLNGASQPNGVPIEVDGGGLEGEAGLVTNGAAVENLAFYSFAGTVLALEGDINIIAGNRFGTSWNDVTDPDLADALRNGGDALVVSGDGTEIRNNLIAGSRTGIRASGADSLRIVGNQIGDLDAPNGELGILIENAFEPRVGSFTSGEGNVIAYNLGGGVKIDGDSPRILVARNAITDNRGDGLWVRQPSNPSFLTVIGGGEADQGNRIARNDGVGVRILGPSENADGPVAVSVQSNVIEDNRDYGIVLEGGSRVRIGGEVASTYGAAPGNTISSGINLASGFSTTIQGNVIGNLDDRGVSTADPALRVRGSRNTVGGDGPLVGNALVGTPDPSLGARGSGILNEGTETLIAHNFVGTDGTSAQGFENGVVLRTSATVHTNVIAGNAEAGVLIESGSSATLTANLIGTDAEGRTAVPNGGPGIDVAEGSATIGGEKEGEACEDPCNLISGNGGPGILVRAEGSASIQGNVIGGALAGQQVLGNGGSGVELHSDGVRVGGLSDVATLGTCGGPCNRIVGNGGDGIRAFEEVTIVTPNDPAGAPTAGEDGASGIVVQGNAIGGDFAGAGNRGSGVAFGGGGRGNVVGGGDTGAGNRIVGNGRSGVALHPNTSGDFFASETQGLIRENVIYGNTVTAIDLNPDNRISQADGWSRLDAGDEDEGPNDVLNWPYLVESRRTGPNDSELLVLWTGESGTYSLDVYASPTCVSGSSAAIPVTTRGVTFDGSLGETVLVEDISTAVGSYLTATIRATGADGITSEVSNCRGIGRRGTQASANVDPEVATAINDVIVTLRNGTPAQPAGPLRSQGASSQGASSQGVSQTLLVAQFEESESSAPFEEASAQAPSGASVRPRSTAGPQWEVTALAGDPGGFYDLCLRAEGLGADAERAVLVAAGPATNGRWRPFDTRIDTVEGVAYACADGVLPGSAYTLATADAPVLVAPSLLAPADGATDVATAPTLTWGAVLGAERYDVQVDRAGTFETPDAEQTGVEATAALFEGLDGLTTYAWRVRATSADGVGPWSEARTFTTTMAVGTEAPSGEPEEVLPAAFALAAYPNPARHRLTVEVALPAASAVHAEVLDVLGRRVATLHDGMLAAGTHPLALDAARLPAGLYVVRAVTPAATLTRRLTVVR